jgi:hypothetical protein
MKKIIPFIAILFAQNLCAQNNDTTQQKPIDCFEIVSDVSDYKENIKAIQAMKSVTE